MRLRDSGALRRFVPVDVSEGALRAAATPSSPTTPGACTPSSRLRATPGPVACRWAAHGGVLGGTIGNLVPDQRAVFLRSVRDTLTAGETLLLGTDLVKSPDVLVPAYDDAAGVTAEFNKNVLHVVDRELKADFDPDEFAHVAIWDAEAEWIEMRLRSLRDQRVRIELLNLDVSFARARRCVPRCRPKSFARASPPSSTPPAST